MLPLESHRMDWGTFLCERVHFHSDLSSAESQQATGLKTPTATVLKVNLMSARTDKEVT